MQTLDVVAAVIVDRGEVLAARRAPGREAAGEWEFPGGKIEPGETPAEALVRELDEELGIRVQVGPTLGTDITEVAGRLIRLTFVTISLIGPRPAASTDHDELKWLAPARLGDVVWAAPDRAMVARLLAGTVSI